MIGKKRPLIGIPAFVSSTSFGSGLNHLTFADKFGDVILLMPWMTQEDYPLDLLYLPGGMDINPSSYGEIPSYQCKHTDVHKQFFYDKRLPAYIEANTPVFGVCLGMQQLAAYFGCKLRQHMMFHDQSPDRWMKAHKVKTFDNKQFDVNSHHHQGLMRDDLNTRELISLAECKDDEGTIVEAFEHRNLPIAGVQWHPEEWYDEFSIRLMNALLAGEKLSQG